jgi:hypothetical protein
MELDGGVGRYSCKETGWAGLGLARAWPQGKQAATW